MPPREQSKRATGTADIPGRIKTEGYESDSSDDGEGVVFSRRAAADGAANGDEDDDMFATDGPKDGQEFGRGSGDDEEDESSDDDEPEDEDDAERRKKAGMGYELSSFNMREEMEEGKFSADGMYVRNFDPHALHDRWMDGLGEREINLARKRKRRQEKAQKEKMQAEERELEQLGGKEAIEREVLGMLKKGETVLEALQRLGARARQNKTKQSGSASRTSQDTRGSTDQQRTSSLPDVEHLTHLASTLLSLGDIVRSVRSAGKVGPSWVPPSADVKYEYNGTEEEMLSWYKASYFGLNGEKVKVRPVTGDWGSWSDFL
ncbi:hypothetical protein BGW80DRAFT_1434407 [Lactifluus volemus]|nr:hypothetical protein BGW80DRAFT_1434407 [Lactifluus volemus]